MKTIALLHSNNPQPVLPIDYRKPEELKDIVLDKLHTGVAHFFFTKKDGATREAYGTLNKELLTLILGEQEEKEADTSDPTTQTVQRYWDIEAHAFRAYTIANLIALF